MIITEYRKNGNYEFCDLSLCSDDELKELEIMKKIESSQNFQNQIKTIEEDLQLNTAYYTFTDFYGKMHIKTKETSCETFKFLILEIITYDQMCDDVGYDHSIFLHSVIDKNDNINSIELLNGYISTLKPFDSVLKLKLY